MDAGGGQQLQHAGELRGTGEVDGQQHTGQGKEQLPHETDLISGDTAQNVKVVPTAIHGDLSGRGPHGRRIDRPLGLLVVQILHPGSNGDDQGRQQCGGQEQPEPCGAPLHPEQGPHP